MKSVTIYTGPLCNFCDAAKRLLTRNNVEYKEINIATVDGAMDEMIKKANGKRTIPQIFFDDQHIGGYDDLRALEKENKNFLQELLKYLDKIYSFGLKVRQTPLLQYLFASWFRSIFKDVTMMTTTFFTMILNSFIP